MSSAQRFDSNNLPRSVVIEEGIPKRETHPVINARATVHGISHIRNWNSFRPSREPVNDGEKI